MDKKRKIIITIIIISIFILGFCIIKKVNNSEKIETEKVKPCTITQIVEASGTINPVNTVSVGSTVSGLVKEIFVDFNSEVKRGQILAQIDPTTFQAAVEQNLANINNAQANLARLQAEEDMYKKTYIRYKNLYEKNFVAKSELDQAESNYKANLAQIKAAKAQISQAEAQYRTAKANLNYTKIIAPVDGTVISRQVDVGQSVAASFQAPELFTIAQDLKKMQIEVSVSEADIGKVKEGQNVVYALDGYPNDEFYGKVTQVRLSSTNVSNVVTYSVIVDVENVEFKLKPGMTANVSIITNQKEDILCVPNSALKISMDRDKKYETQGIWILKGTTPTRYNIQVGVSDDNYFEVKSDEIKKGDNVIINIIDKKNLKKNIGRRGFF